MLKSFKALYWTYGVSLLLAVVFFFCKNFLAEEAVSSRTGLALLIFKGAYMWIPGLFAFIYARKEKISFPLNTSGKIFYFYAILIPVLISTLSFFISLFYSTVNPSKIIFFSGNIYQDFFSNFFFLVFFTIVGSATVNLLFAFGEEVMWRGFLWEKIKFLGFWKASIVIGVLWGVWHVPIVLLLENNYPAYSLLGSLWMIIFCVLMSPLYLYFRVRSESILVPSLLHGMFNGFGLLSLMIFQKPNAFLVGITGVAGFIVYLFVNLLIYYLLSQAKDLSIKT